MMESRDGCLVCALREVSGIKICGDAVFACPPQTPMSVNSFGVSICNSDEF